MTNDEIEELRKNLKTLTPAERKIYDLLVTEGLTDKSISEKLQIAVSTVRTHKDRIYQKLCYSGLNAKDVMIIDYWKSKNRFIPRKESENGIQ